MAIPKKTLKSVFTPVEIRALCAMFSANAGTNSVPLIEQFRKSDDELLTIVAGFLETHAVDADSIFLSELEPRKVAYAQLLHRNPKAVFDASATVAEVEDTAQSEDTDTEGEAEMATPRPVVAPRPATPAAAAPKPAAPAAAAPAAARPVAVAAAPASPKPATPAASAARPPVAASTLRPAVHAGAAPAPKPTGAVSPAATPAAATKEPETAAASTADITAVVTSVVQAALVPVFEKLAEVGAQVRALQESLEAASSDDETVAGIARDARTTLSFLLGQQLRRLGMNNNTEVAEMLSSMLEADYTDPPVLVESLLPVSAYGLEEG